MKDSRHVRESREIQQLAFIGKTIRQERKSRGLTLEELAGAVGLSITFLSRLERGQVACSIGNLLEISAVLELSPRVLFANLEAGDGSRNFTVVRASAPGNKRASPGAPYGWQHLASGSGEQRLESFILELPGNKKDTPLVTHPGEEFCFVLDGRVTFQIGDEVTDLETGDSIHLRSDVPHMAWSDDERPTRLLMVSAIPNHTAEAVEWWARATKPKRKK
jgi:transcriptional regulator with XRE-family HTH domain